MTSEEKVAAGYVMVACVPYIRTKTGIRFASKYGKRCFPIWKKAKTTV